MDASVFIENKKCKYFANVYNVYQKIHGWVIIIEKLEPLDNDTIKHIKKICIKTNSFGEYNLDELNLDEQEYDDLPNRQKSLYDDLVNMRKEAEKYGFELLDCKLENLGMKNNHLAMFDMKHTGKFIGSSI